MAKKEEPTAVTIPCRVCAEEIKPAALKCRHCDSYQDWRRQLNFSATVLSLLVALISVIGSTAPALWKLHADSIERSDLRFSFQGADERIVSAFVSNTGNRPASVSEAILFIVGDEPNDIASYRLDMLGSEGVGQVVGPGQSRLINFSTFGSVAIAPPTPDSRCGIAIQYTNFDSTQGQKVQYLDCARLRNFIDLRVHRPVPTEVP